MWTKGSILLRQNPQYTTLCHLPLASCKHGINDEDWRVKNLATSLVLSWRDSYSRNLPWTPVWPGFAAANVSEARGGNEQTAHANLFLCALHSIHADSNYWFISHFLPLTWKIKKREKLPSKFPAVESRSIIFPTLLGCRDCQRALNWCANSEMAESRLFLSISPLYNPHIMSERCSDRKIHQNASQGAPWRTHVTGPCWHSKRQHFLRFCALELTFD